MSAYTDEDVTAVCLALQKDNTVHAKENGLGARCHHCRAIAEAVLAAVAPAIAARALREAADAIVAETPNAPYNAGVIERWLRARAEAVGE